MRALDILGAARGFQPRGPELHWQALGAVTAQVPFLVKVNVWGRWTGSVPVLLSNPAFAFDTMVGRESQGAANAGSGQT